VLTSCRSRWIVGLVLGLVTAIVARPAISQEFYEKPAVVVSVAKIDRLMKDIGFLTGAAGTPELGGLALLLAGDYLQGLNLEQPIGVLLTMQGGEPSGLGFLPITDFEAVKDQIAQSAGELRDDGDGVWELQLQRSLYLKQKEGWLFFSNSAANLARLPADPVKLLDGLDTQYEIAVQVRVQNIPGELRELALSEMRASFERGLADQAANALGDLTPEQRQLQEAQGRQMLESFAKSVEQMDHVTLGWGVDREAGTIFLDLGLVPTANSELSAQVKAYQETKSAFAGILPADAAMTAQLTMTLGPQEIAQALATLEVARKAAMEQIAQDQELPNDDTREAARSILNGLIDLFVATFKEGKLDTATGLILQPQAVQLVAGARVADGRAVEAQAQKLLELARKLDDNSNLDAIQLNADKHRDFNLHTLNLPIPENESDARRVLGDKISVALATGDKALYLVVGPNSLEGVKGLIDRAAETGEVVAVPAKLHMSMVPLIEFALAMEQRPSLETFTKALKQKSDKDGAAILIRTSEKGFQYRIEVEEGVLRLIGAAQRIQNDGANF
jgi:hypothetical protein